MITRIYVGRKIKYAMIVDDIVLFISNNKKKIEEKLSLLSSRRNKR